MHAQRRCLLTLPTVLPTYCGHHGLQVAVEAAHRHGAMLMCSWTAGPYDGPYDSQM